MSAGTGVALTAAGVTCHNPVFVLLGLLGVTSSLLLRRLPLDLAVVMSALGLLLVAVAAGMLADSLQLDLLGHPTVVVVVYVSYAGAVLFATAVRPPRGARPRSPAHWWVQAPAVLALATAILQSVSTTVAKSWAFWGSDLARHMSAISRIQQDGALDYAGNGYPRGLHMLASLVSVPSAPIDRPVSLLEYDLRLTAALTWLSLALVLWTGAALTVRMTSAVSGSQRLGSAAAVLLGSGMLLTNDFIGAFVYMGAAPSLLAIAVMWATPLLAVERGTSMKPLGLTVATCAVVVSLAHLWQALVVVPCAALFVGLVFRRFRMTRIPRLFPGWGAVGIAFLLGSAVLLGAGPPLFSVVAAGGTGLASIEGNLPGNPYPLVTLGLASAPLLLRVSEDWARLMLGSAAGMIAVIALLLHGASGGFDLEQYYPMKAAWFLGLLLAPWLCLALSNTTVKSVGLVARGIGQLGRAALIMQWTTWSTVLALVGAFFLPRMLDAGAASLGAWKLVNPGAVADRSHPEPSWSAQRYDIARHYGSVYSAAAVVPYFVGNSAVFDPMGTRLVSILLSFMTEQREVTGDGQDICERIESLADSGPAVVVSRMKPEIVRSDMVRSGCGNRARVIRVPGGISDVELRVRSVSPRG